MTLAINPAELDELFDLDIDIVMPAPQPIRAGIHTPRMDPSVACGTTSECGTTSGSGIPPRTSISTCDSYGQTGHPCRCF